MRKMIGIIFLRWAIMNRSRSNTSKTRYTVRLTAAWTIQARTIRALCTSFIFSSSIFCLTTLRISHLCSWKSLYF